MLEKICNVAYKLKVGMKVRCNGSGFSDMPEFLEGIIGEIDEDVFHIWQNKMDGFCGRLSPLSAGYNFSWEVFINNKVGKIEILEKKDIKEFGIVKFMKDTKECLE